MKIAFVNQPIDTVVPPYQTSVGICTYGVARLLAKSCEVVVYGLKDVNPDGVPANVRSEVDFRFLPAAKSDRLIMAARNKYSRLVRTSQAASSSRLWYPQYARQVAEDLQKRGCDVIHIQHCSQYVPVIRALNPKAKIVLHRHAHWFSQMKLSVFEARVGGVDLLTGVSDHITNRMRLDFPMASARCRTTYNGFNAEEFSHRKDYAAIRQRTEKRILYTGAISPHRGIHVLLEAFKIVVARYPNVRLDLIGPEGNYPLEETFDLRDRTSISTVSRFYAKNRLLLLKEKLLRTPSGEGTYFKRLKESIPPNVAGKITFLGAKPHSDLVDPYYDADVFVFPSVCDEGFGLPPVEAMAAGTPVVASRSGAVAETVLDQQTGFLFPKNDPEGLASGILRLVENDRVRETMGRAARERAFRHFTWDRVADDMLERYRALIASSPEHLRVPSTVSARFQSGYHFGPRHSTK